MPVRPDARRRRAPARPTTPTLAASWEAMPWSMRILRAFLGGTFVFAGVQKFLDPNFLHAGSETYIGTQLQGFAHGTPVAPLMNLLAKFPLVTGVGVAITEIAVGLGTLLGVGLMLAATVGLADQPHAVALRHLAHPSVFPRLGLHLRGRVARVAGGRARGGTEPVPRTDALDV